MSRAIFHGPKDVRAIAVRQYNLKEKNLIPTLCTKRRQFAPSGNKFFSFGVHLFLQKRYDMLESKQEVLKGVILENIADNLSEIFSWVTPFQYLILENIADNLSEIFSWVTPFQYLLFALRDNTKSIQSTKGIIVLLWMIWHFPGNGRKQSINSLEYSL